MMPKFSILIPTWNSFDYLKLCVESIRKNSATKHQILVYVNEGIDGTREWLADQADIEWIGSDTNQGVCLALNALRTLVKTDYIVFANDDMYLLPGWDTAYWEEIRKLPDNKWFLSSTSIQPRRMGSPSLTPPADYGQSPQTFREADLLADYKNLGNGDFMGASMPLNIVATSMWDLVDGYSIEFTPGMWSDPDFVAKLWFVGVRYFKVLNDSIVYHFEAVSTGKVKKNKGNYQFLYKWGIKSSVFRRVMTHRSEPWNEAAHAQYDEKRLKRGIFMSRLKALLCLHKYFKSLDAVLFQKMLNKS